MRLPASRFFPLLAVLAIHCDHTRANAAETLVTIRADFPGGNVVVEKNEGERVQIAPDLRGGAPWFYWHFEAVASQPGDVTFSFAGSPLLSVQGPAFSTDDGHTWKWLGRERSEFAAVTTPAKERRESFTYHFPPNQLRARFAVAIPYLPENLTTFLRANKDNSRLQVSQLTKTRNGTPVELLQIGELGAGRATMLVTARHHACESMASFVLEGFLAEAMAESNSGIEFRRRYCLFAVPLVDRDGVAAGDQGKNRDPHDHNRDYGPQPIYPEIAAIQALGEAHDIRYTLDFHCPFLRGDIHEAFHFLGLGTPRVQENLNEFIAWVREERPPLLMTPLNFLTDAKKPNAVNPKISSHHFALRPGAVIAATLESPYTQSATPLTPDLAREYGRGLLRAWVHSEFAATDAKQSRGATASVELQKLRTGFQPLYRGKPAEAESLVRAHLDNAAAPAVLKNEARILLALLRHQQKKSTEAKQLLDESLRLPLTAQQRATAWLQLLQLIADEPATDAPQLDALFDRFQAIPYLSNEQQAKGLLIVGKFHESRRDYARAIDYARRQQLVAASHETGRVLLRIAELHDLAEQPQLAVNARETAAKLLRERLGPTPQRSVFAAMMTLDLFDALRGHPSSTVAEIQAAAKQALDHEVLAEQYKTRIRQQLAELEAKR